MLTTSFRCGLAGSALVALLVTGPVAAAETVPLKAELKGTNQTPPNDSKGTGTADVSYDTTSKNLTWTITYSGLTGDATAAHFHGPATDKTAGIAVPITGDLKSP